LDPRLEVTLTPTILHILISSAGGLRDFFPLAEERLERRFLPNANKEYIEYYLFVR
jgi:hypothetical protein